ncbi:MAG: hypothetical protein ACI8RZ_000520 [Myxococcota bacterium]|jgi:hypothetical protein
MDPDSRPRLLELLRNPGHYKQGVELALSLDDTEAIVAAMMDTTLSHWGALLEVVMVSIGPELVALCIVLAADYPAPIAEEIAALLADEDPAADALFEVCLRMVAGEWGPLDEALDNGIEQCWMTGGDSRRVKRLLEVLSEASLSTWDGFYHRLVLDGWPEQALQAVLLSPLSHEPSVLQQLDMAPWLRTVMPVVLSEHPPSKWRHLLRWTSGRLETSPAFLQEMLLSNLDDLDYVEALLGGLRPRAAFQVRLLSELLGDWSGAVRAAIAAFIEPRILDDAGRALLAEVAERADDAIRPVLIATLSAACPDADRLDHGLLVLRLLPQTADRAAKHALAQTLRAPIPMPQCAAILAGSAMDAEALLVGLRAARDPAVVDLIRPLADGSIQAAVAAQAAETLGLLWRHLGAPSVPTPASMGLSLALARAGQVAHRKHLQRLAPWDADAALALTRLAVLEDRLEVLEPDVVRRATRSGSAIAGDWLADLAGAILQPPLATGTVSVLERAQILALGDHVLAVVSARIQGTGADVRCLSVVCDRADWLLDVLPAGDGDQWWEHGRKHLRGHTDAVIADALREAPGRLDAARALPLNGPRTEAVIAALCDHPEHGTMARAVEKARL